MHRIKDLQNYAEFTDLIQYLSVLGLGVKSKTDAGNTLLHLAAEKATTWVISELVELGAEVNARNNEGETAGIIAARSGHLKNVEVLHALGADFNLYDSYKDSALLWAAYYDYIHIVKYLVEVAAVDVDHLYTNGQSAIGWAAARGNVDIVDYLFFKTTTINSGKNICTDTSVPTRELVRQRRRAGVGALASAFAKYTAHPLLEPGLFKNVLKYWFSCEHCTRAQLS